MPCDQPQLVCVKWEKRNPTQITVVREDVALDRHWFPAVSGLGSEHHIVNHHHFGLALLQDSVKAVLILGLKYYLSVVELDAVTRCLEKLQGESYRGVTGELLCADRYAKEVTPASEFLLAVFLRNMISCAMLHLHFVKVLVKPMKLPGSQDARYLPGWTDLISGF